jgi:hypothetical protein
MASTSGCASFVNSTKLENQQVETFQSIWGENAHNAGHVVMLITFFIAPCFINKIFPPRLENLSIYYFIKENG